MKTSTLSGLASLFFFISVSCMASTIDFEQFTDSEVLTTQIPGLTFSNTIVLTAGISLNELEFPPHSGQNVASDNGGPLTITFTTPISSFSGYFTYTTTVTLQGSASTNNLIASTTSAYSANWIGSGVANATPNELLQISSNTGFNEITITGDPAGGSFVMDDISYSPLATTVPEPPSGALVAAFGTLLLFLLRTHSKRSV